MGEHDGKPSCVRFRTFVKRSSELATAAMTQEVLGCRREAAHLKRTGQGYNFISGSFRSDLTLGHGSCLTAGAAVPYGFAP